MKIAVIIVRILFGALLIFASLNYFFNFFPMETPEGEVGKFVIGLDAARYVMPLIKVIELIVGISLLAGYYVPLATIVIFPISLNIFLFHLFLAPDGAVVGSAILLFNLFLAYYHRQHYKPILSTAK